MARIIRLTENDLTRLVKRIIREQEKGGNDEGGPDRDWWALDLAPKLKDAGFVSKTAPKFNVPCINKCCTYMYKGNHDTGTNVLLNCGEGNTGVWTIEVYNLGGKNKKTFPAGQKGAEKAVIYALSLR